MRRENGTGSVYKLSGKRSKPFAAAVSYYDETDRYKLKQHTIGTFRTKREALAALDRYNVERGHETTVGQPQITFEQVFEKWSDRYLENGSYSRKKAYMSAYKKCESLYKMPMSEIKLRHLQSIMDEYSGTSKSTQNNLKVLMSAIFEYAVKYDYIEKDYSKFVEFGAVSKVKEKQIFTSEEIKKLWSISDDDTAAITLILLYTGYRITELLEMPIKNINLDEAYTIGGKKTSAGKDRIVPIHHKILPLIKRIIEKSNYDVFYIYSYATFNSNFNVLMKKLKIHHTIHETRHTFASALDSAGVPESISKRLLGHSFQDITQDVYIHKTIEELRIGIEKITFCQ